MKDNVYWVLELSVKSSKVEALRGAMKAMVEAARGEPGTLSYEWSIAADGASCHIHERYEDSDAVLIHMAAFNTKFAATFLPLVKPTRFVVHGKPNTKVKEALAPYEPEYMAPLGGFRR